MKHRKSPYTSTFYMWKGVAAFFYSSHLTSFHSHNTIQLILDTQKDFRFKTENSSWATCKSLIIKENVLHQLDTNGSVQLIIYLDAETRIARSIKSKYLVKNEVQPLDLNVFHFVNSKELQQALLIPDPSILESVINKVLACLSLEMGNVRTDQRIILAEQTISTTHPEDITIKSVADKVCLSESRLRYLFKQVTGVSLYRYMLWNKIWYATNQIMAGYSVNEAAIDAGFTDGSHFHKMMVQMFGISPSKFLKDNMPDNLVVCDKSPLHFETYVYHHGQNR
ncbi:helix-turn-helix domain-containing protein [Mucilaginibacter sp. BT774]|uniref:helix-turn-helix domain-containing protein n=1 Tax=Mucilaginibacter sp. BT774 TaxID=3062276 RepID=UPI002675EE43|nr:AraC family transcriptional regulator [Mucilaginibacter sp. BT774]MDO3628592.1 AraC family transcriptional regulator [Mucilaginibacter sp. BT774]